MAASFLLLETGDKVLLETGDFLLLEDIDQTITLGIVDDSAIYGPDVSGAGNIDLPLVDDSTIPGPALTGTVTVPLPLVDDSAAYAPDAFVDQLANLPLIDDSAVYAPSFVQAQFLTLDLIDGGVPFGPLVTNGAEAAFELLVGGVEVEDTFARSFEDQLADTGSFSFQMLRTDFAGVDYDDDVVFKLDGIHVFRGVVEGLDHVALAQGEGADQVVTVSGRGSLALLDQHVVYPSRGVGALPIEEARSFSWVAPDFDSTAWPLAKKVNRQREYANWRAPLPWVWPDTSGYWIWADLPTVTAVLAPSGVCLFRRSFTLASDEVVRVFAAGDNHLRLWIDGAEMATFSSFTVGRYVNIELTAGTHYIAAKVNNDLQGHFPNPGGFICAAYTVGDAGLLDDLLVHSDATWDCLPYPVIEPGFTHGKVIRLLMEEAGIDGDWTLDFTDTHDSDGDPWGVYREITVGVGRTLLETLREMSDTSIDFAVAPGSLTLRAWNRGDRGVVRSATLQQTTNPSTSDFLALSHQGKRTRLNKALIRYGGGHTEYEDTASTGTHGDRGGYLELGAVVGEAVAKQKATQVMANRSEPAYATTATLHPRADSTTPYKAFEVGDWITVPDETDSNASMRVLSITYAEDDNGVVDWPVRLRDHQLELEERHDVWLRRMADGALVGGARVSSRAGTPAPSAQEAVALRVAEFSYDNTALVASTSPHRPAEVTCNLVEIYGELTTAGSTTTTVVVDQKRVGGAWTALGTLTFAAGETETEVALSVQPIYANVDKLRARITAVGTGAEGLDVQVRGL